MAKRAIDSGVSREVNEALDNGENFRVKYSYGTFSVSVSDRKSGKYIYAYKRVNRQLVKQYVGKVGKTDDLMLHDACSNLLEKCREFTSRLYLKDYQGYG